MTRRPSNRRRSQILSRHVYHALGGGDVTRVVNTTEMRDWARARLPRVVFEGIDGGAGDEHTMNANQEAFERIWLRPRALADVSVRDLTTTVLGQPVSMPLLLDPCGFARMCDSDAELAVARAAARSKTVFAVSGAASCTPEDVAAATTGPLWYQLYMPLDDGEVRSLVERVKDAGYRVLCVSVDTAVTPKRDKDVWNRLTVPLEPSPQLLLAGLSRPRWAKDFVLGKVGRGQGFRAARIAYWNFTDALRAKRSVTLDDVAWLRELWDGPLVVKGIMRGDEVPAIVERGVDGLVVSNHGGRNLDFARGTMDILPEVVAAAGGRAEVFVDGGVRRGVDVLKAVALGARAALIGRPYLYGLAAGGEEGVHHVLELLRIELETAMGLAGCATVADIDRSLVSVDGIDEPVRSPGERVATGGAGR